MVFDHFKPGQDYCCTNVEGTTFRRISSPAGFPPRLKLASKGPWVSTIGSTCPSLREYRENIRTTIIYSDCQNINIYKHEENTAGPKRKTTLTFDHLKSSWLDHPGLTPWATGCLQIHRIQLLTSNHGFLEHAWRLYPKAGQFPHVSFSTPHVGKRISKTQVGQPLNPWRKIDWSGSNPTISYFLLGMNINFLYKLFDLLFARHPALDPSIFHWYRIRDHTPSDHAGRDFSCSLRAVTPIESQFAARDWLGRLQSTEIAQNGF